MSVINYSKWDSIEISDDEDDTHPNVDTPSLFKWRHESRIMRKEEEAQKKKQKDAESKLRSMQIDMMKKKAEQLKKDNGDAAAAQLKDLEKEIAAAVETEQDFRKKEAELEAYQKAHPKWDVDNISRDKQSRTIINKASDSPNDMEMTEFFKKYEKEIQTFGHLTDPKDSQKFLMENMHLVCDHLASYLVVWCVDLEVEGKTPEMKTVAHQCICAQFIMELAKSIKQDPRACVNAFFVRMIAGEEQYKAGFNDELSSFIARVQARAKVKLAEAEAQVAAEEAKEREARLGPGGLDPIEVMESLPEKIQEAFRTQNTPLLKEGFSELSPEDFKHHYTRAVQSGLWVPQGGEAGAEDDAADADDEAGS